MSTLALAIGYLVLLCVALLAAYCAFDWIASRATYAWCMTLGAYNLNLYRHNWSRLRMFCWLFFTQRLYLHRRYSIESSDGQFLMRWNSWYSWDYAGKRKDGEA